MSGPLAWQMPLFGSPPSGAVPPIVINGRAVEGTLRSYSAEMPEQGVVVANAGGQGIPHVLFPSAAAPATLGPWEGELEFALDSEDDAAWLMLAPGLARGGLLSVWLDAWIVDVWVGNGSRTTFGLSRSTGYGSTGVSWADRPARCFVGATELTMVTAAPAAGQCQLSQTADANSIVLGTAPASGAHLSLRYYPVRAATASLDMDLSDLNDGTVTLQVIERIPPRAYAS